MTSAEDRYRTLLQASCTIADQPTVKAVVHSLRGVLYNTCAIHGVDLYILGDNRDSLHLLEFDKEAYAPLIKTGTKISRIGGVARVLEEQQPIFIPDVSREMLNILSWLHLHPILSADALISFQFLPPRCNTECLR